MQLMAPIGKFPGPLGANAVAGLTTDQLKAKIATEVEKRVVKQIGKRLSALALRKAASRIIGKMAVGSRYWVKAFEHIALHFSEQSLAKKAVHSVFSPKFRTRQAVEELIRQGASKTGRRTLTKATIETAGESVPLGKPVIILEREFSQVIGEELRRSVQNNTEVIMRVECKILRIIVDYTGKPISAYPVSKFL
jgi:hypothetical protein